MTLINCFTKAKSRSVSPSPSPSPRNSSRTPQCVTNQRTRGITFQGAPSLNPNQNPNTLHPLGMYAMYPFLFILAIFRLLA